ncbi:MAG: hypothetical protein AAF549_09390 [Pseudomonadota bacterium]
MQKVAVFDIGTARTKLTIASQSEEKIVVEKWKMDTNLGDLFSTGYHADLTVKSSRLLRESLLSLSKNIKDPENTHRMSILTEVFREFPNLINEIENMSDIIGTPKVISGHDEGLLFYKSISNVLNNPDFALLDVGGGSIQLTYSDQGTIKVHSLPLGSYKLQALHQANRNKLSESNCLVMKKYVDKMLSQHLKENLKKDYLVLGSNCMERFLLAAMDKAGIKFKKTNNIDQVSDLLMGHLINVNYTDQTPYFPEDPNFMYGADKALIVALSVAKCIGVRSIIPTDESLSSSLAKQTLTNTHPSL